MNIWFSIAFLLIAYLLGSIPFGYILVKSKTGKNIMEVGSGNTGSTNVRRVAGKKISALTQILDMAKGLFPVAVILILDKYQYVNAPQYFVFYAAIASILGHNYSIFLKFKGGKGVNTTLGASVLLASVAVFVSVAIYFLVKLKVKYVSASSLALSVSLPLIQILYGGISPTFYYLVLCMLLIIFQHRSNIGRLVRREEKL